MTDQDDSDEEICGVIKGTDGEPCEYSPSYDDGKCGIHTDEEDTVGRPSDVAQHEDEILMGAAKGMTLGGCARIAGVDESTLHRYKAKHPSFRKRLNRARARGELQQIENVDEPGARFLLERSYGYMKEEKREVEHSSSEGFWRDEASDDDPNDDA